MTQIQSARSAGTVAHLRPAFHVRPPRGYLNDPNGPIELGDDVHLYFQSRPVLDLQAPVEWGHATSTDYVRWTLHRPAMAPPSPRHQCPTRVPVPPRAAAGDPGAGGAGAAGPSTPAVS